MYHLGVVQRIYFHNYRCFENFELALAGLPSALLIGKNGTGKTTVGHALEILQRIARGTNRVGELVTPTDSAQNRSTAPIRFEIEVKLTGATYHYTVAVELPKGFKESRVAEEKLLVDGRPIYTRTLAEVQLARLGSDSEATFRIDWHLVALPIIQARSEDEPLSIFRGWLSRMLILRPTPPLITGVSKEKTLEPEPPLRNFAAWFSGLLAENPSAYGSIENYLRGLMPEFRDIWNPETGPDSRHLHVHFADNERSFHLPFAGLSDGEKCFFIGAAVLAAKRTNSPLFCFWDEPDNHLSPDEVGHFVIAMRGAFRSGGQFIATSHNAEVIRRFSAESTLLLFRRSRLEPTSVRPLSELQVSGDIVDALIRGDVNP